MWNQDKSVILSQVCTRIIIGFLLVIAIAFPIVVPVNFFDGRALLVANSVELVLSVYYLFCIPAIVALITLDRMLTSIKRGSVFTKTNVRRLRILSWACFAAAAAMLLGAAASIVFAVVAVLAAFFGMILRVVKNLFAAAVELKAENDFTI